MLVGDRCVELPGSEAGFDTPDSTAAIVRSVRTPPPMESITSRSGVPIVNSPTPWRRVSPVTVHRIVPGEDAVPTERYQSTPCRTMPGMLAMVSTLSTSAAGPSSHERPGWIVRGSRRYGFVPRNVAPRHDLEECISSPKVGGGPSTIRTVSGASRRQHLVAFEGRA